MHDVPLFFRTAAVVLVSILLLPLKLNGKIWDGSALNLSDLVANFLRMCPSSFVSVDDLSTLSNEICMFAMGEVCLYSSP